MSWLPAATIAAGYAHIPTEKKEKKSNNQSLVLAPCCFLQQIQPQQKKKPMHIKPWIAVLAFHRCVCQRLPCNSCHARRSSNSTLT
jgi:hypothetical protein